MNVLSSQLQDHDLSLDSSRPFQPGAIVLLTLTNPREKFWGVLLNVDLIGVSFQGIDLSSFEDTLNTIVDGESALGNTLFFPMHRIERLELDLPDGSIPSLSQRFEARTGVPPARLLGVGNAAARSSGA
jgi:hypothetical protein